MFSQLMWDLKSGDLYVEGSDHYADYRDQLIPWSRYQQEIADYGKLVELPTEGKAFVAHVRAWLEERARQTDASFPNEDVRIEKGEPIIRPLEKKPVPEGLAELEALLAERLAPVTPLEILMHTQNWLNWTRFFGPISGYDSKLEHAVARYLTAVFCGHAVIWVPARPPGRWMGWIAATSPGSINAISPSKTWMRRSGW